MTEGHQPSASAPRAPDVFDLLAEGDLLTKAVRRLAAVSRLLAAEHTRLHHQPGADKRAVLDGWRVGIDLLEQAVSGVEQTALSAYDSLVAAGREIDGLQPRHPAR